MMVFLFELSFLLGLAHVVIVLTVMVRVIMKRPATGIALSWLLIVAMLPVAGIVLYLLIGERRIGQMRANRIAELRTSFREIGDAAIKLRMTHVDWSKHPDEAQGMNRLGKRFGGYATVCGSRLELISDSHRILESLAREIDSAKKNVLMEFYIWAEGGAADELLEALIRAANRSVHCQLLVDAVGAGSWWSSGQPERLRAAGVEVLPALPVGLFRTFIGRTDLRLHRKIVVIDGSVAWTGSMNIADPRFFQQKTNVGQWVDAMVRIEGAAVAPLAATVIGDWALESGDPIDKLVASAGLQLLEPDGPSDIQVIPSGPGESADGLLQMLLTLINSARDEIVMTTPYFVPEDALKRAIRGASGRGVDVSIVLPKRVNSFLTRHASRSYYDDLLDVGVKIFLFRGGLLHTKSVVVDGKTSMFGTVNFDMRSLWLNYEVSLFIYDTVFGALLRELQQEYIDASDLLDATQWQARPFRQRLLENTLRLLSPLL